jgi:hypothetical protein
MAVGFTTLRLETLRLLNEVNDTVVGEVATGVGGTATSDTDDAILLYLNEAAADMCRTCVYFPVSVNVTGHTGRIYSHAQGLLVSPIDIKLSAATAPLIHCGENELRSYDSSYLSATGTPSYWYKIGTTAIGLYSVPTTSTSFTITGSGLETAILEGSGTYSFISDDLLLQALPAYAAQKIALKNYDDPALVGRAFWKDWYDQVRMQLWTRMDMSLKGPNGLFSIPPVAMASK